MRALAVILLLVGWIASPAADVQNVRMWPAPDNTRVVFDVSRAVDYRVFKLADPDRVVIDIKNARMNITLPKPIAGDKRLTGIRAARRNAGDLRVVLDLSQQVDTKSFSLPPNKQYGHRLVVDLLSPQPVPSKSITGHSGFEQFRDVIIAIDAGHGGEDPGAVGSHGTPEKHVVLAIARRLAALINEKRGMQAVLIRDGDYFIGLRDRMTKAREQKADLFVSLHADAFHDRRVRGSSVYVLSKSGASSEAARWLAEQENASDFIGGVSLEDKDDLLRSVLIDLSQTAVLDASIEAGTVVLGALERAGKVHKRRVQYAGFVVLKSPDVPSILIETAFISNPREERKLTDAHHQRILAKAISDGLRSYFSENGPPGTLFALRKHRIDNGDTLADIARRYQVSAESLRVANDLSDDKLQVGDVLRIP